MPFRCHVKSFKSSSSFSLFTFHPHHHTTLSVMGEVLPNSVPVTMKWNGFACQNRVYMPSHCKDRTCYGGLYGISAIKTGRSHERICELNVVSMSMKRDSWFGCLHLTIPQMSVLFGSTRIINSFSVSAVITSNEFESVFQQNEEKELVQKGKELEMDSFGQNLPPWGNLMVQRELNKHPESAVQPLSMLSKNTVAVNDSRVHFLEETDEEMLSERILMLSRSNKVRSAMELFRSMEFSGLQANGHACNSLVSCLIRNNMVDNALRVFEFMKKNEIATAHAYSLILKAIASIQGCDSAVNMFAELEGFSRERKNFDVIVYNTMISVCGRANNWVEAERIWISMKENGHRGTQVTYWLLVSIFVRCGQNELALDAYNEMVHHELRPRDDTMQAVIGACTREGKWHLALNVFQNMLNRGLKPNLVACNALINSLGKAGEVKLAFKVFDIVKSLGHTPDAYTWNGLLSGLYRANQHANALQLFESIKRDQSSELNEHLYNTALMSCQKLGLWDKALQLLWQVEASGLSVSTASYNLVIGACEVSRKPKVALEVYEHMVHQKCTPDTFTYLSLIRGCIWASLWVEVEEILDQVAPDVSLYNAVIHGMCLRGKAESAKKLYMKMRKSGLKPDGKTRALMLQILRRHSSKRSILSSRY